WPRLDFLSQEFLLQDDPRTRRATFVIHRDAHLLVKEARRLSRDAKTAIAEATPHLYGLENLFSGAVSEELLIWFDDCAEHYTIMGRPFAWIVKACHNAQQEITRALSSNHVHENLTRAQRNVASANAMLNRAYERLNRSYELLNGSRGLI